MSRPARVGRRARSIAAVVVLGLMTAGHGAQAQGASETNKHPMLTALNTALPLPGGLAGLLPGLGGNGIRYHGGPIMVGEIHPYAIWYGNWTGNTTPTIVTDFFGNVGVSPYFKINTTYTDSSKNIVSGPVALKGSITVGGNYKRTLSDADVKQIVADSISSGGLPRDASGVYFVLTSADIGESSGFLTSYCGWHTSATLGSTDIKYSFVGDASKNLSACAGQTGSSPNGNVAGDAMVNVIAHELEEAATDPDLNAWYDFTQKENADKCAWKFGTTYTSANGAKANMKLGARDYLIQQNWLNAAGGSCVLSYR
jgi:hypothetical protein